MNFIADINIAQAVIRFLRQNGHEVIDIKKLNQTSGDIEIVQLAIRETKIILTHDRDFETLTKYPKYEAGTVLIRLTEQNAKHFCERLTDLLSEVDEKTLLSQLTILTEDGFEPYPYLKLKS